MLKQGLNQKLLQKLSPQQIQFIQLLQLNTLEFERRLEEEITENPALEKTDSSADEDDSSEDKNEEEVQGEDFEIDDYLPDDDSYDTYIPKDPNEERKEIPISNYRTLYDQLDEQLGATTLSEREEQLAHHLVGMIEEDGYLRRPLKNIVYDLAFLSNIKTTEEELEKVLKVIQSFEPAGIAARDLRECLLIQLERRDDINDPDVKLAHRIIADYMDELANKHYTKMLKSLKIEKEDLREALDVITRLNPKPGENQSTGKIQYVNPDFIVTMVGGELQVSLNSRNAPSLKVSKSYQETLSAFKESKEKSKKMKDEVQFIKQKLDGAKWFIDAIRQRQQTLLITMRTIVELQKDFFHSGDFTKLRPMVLKDIADRIGMDISTVSRVASSKYVQTDFGIFSLKEFFSEGIQTAEGEEVSNREVKEILQDIVNNENKSKPYTDEKLTKLLNEKGYNIARRTIAKYREQLNIPVARLRKGL